MFLKASKEGSEGNLELEKKIETSSPSPPERGLGGEAIHSRLTADKSNWYRHLKGFSAEMRCHPTAAENILWQALRNRQLAGIKFRRQHTIGNYIVDFISLDHSLIIEVDGDVHLETGQAEYDAGRTYDLREQGYRILRFSNEQVINHLSEVVSQVQQALPATQ